MIKRDVAKLSDWELTGLKIDLELGHEDDYPQFVRDYLNRPSFWWQKRHKHMHVSDKVLIERRKRGLSI